MTTRLQLRRGTAAQHANFTGAAGELSVNTTTNTLHVHDGVTVGGIPQGAGTVAADLATHTGNTSNPHAVTKAQVGLGSVDNVSASSLRDRTTHTGSQTASTISDFAATVRATLLTGFSTAVSAAVTAADSVLAGVGKLQAQVNAVLDRALTGLSVATSTAVVATDSILVGIGKLQAQVTLRALLAANTFTGDQTLGGNKVIEANLQKVTEVQAAPAISAGVLALDLANGRSVVSLNAAVTSITFSNNVASATKVQSHTLTFTADGTARSVVWPAGNGTSTLLIKWPGGTAPTLTSTNGKRDTFQFVSVNTYLWDAFIVGQNL